MGMVTDNWETLVMGGRENGQVSGRHGGSGSCV